MKITKSFVAFIYLISLSFVFCLLRIVFFLVNLPSFQEVERLDIIRALWLGLRFDLRLAAIILLPILLLLPFRKINRGVFKLYQIFYGFLLAGVILLYLVDFAFFQATDTRLNFGIVSLLEDPTMALIMVWETYPVIPSVIGLLILFVLLIIFSERWLSFLTRGRIPGSKLFSCGSIFLGWTFAIYGQIDRYPLGWVQVFFSNNTAVSNLGLNPVLNLFDTALRHLLK